MPDGYTVQNLTMQQKSDHATLPPERSQVFQLQLKATINCSSVISLLQPEASQNKKMFLSLVYIVHSGSYKTEFADSFSFKLKCCYACASC